MGSWITAGNGALPINGGKSVVGGVVDGVVAVVVEGETEGLVDADGSVIKGGLVAGGESSSGDSTGAVTVTIRVQEETTQVKDVMTTRLIAITICLNLNISATPHLIQL